MSTRICFFYHCFSSCDLDNIEYILEKLSTREKVMSGNKVYDISPEEREVKEWRYTRRLELRKEYLKEVQDPRRVDPILDRGWQRFYATRVQLEYIFKPTLFNTLLMIAATGGLIWGTAMMLKTSRANKEKLYRTGQISYQDRMFKFQ